MSLRSTYQRGEREEKPFFFFFFAFKARMLSRCPKSAKPKFKRTKREKVYNSDQTGEF